MNSSVMVAAYCNNCKVKYPEFWLSRDHQGYPDYGKAICGNCGAKHSIFRDWQDQQVNAIIPPVEDGNINRFEYEYTDDNGKKTKGKMDPSLVKKHFENNNKGK